MVDTMGILALSATFFYQLNGHVLKHIGKQNWVSPMALTWILHVLVVSLAPQAYWKRRALGKELDTMKRKTSRFLFDVVVNSFLQMSINYFWMLSSQQIPTQLTAAIYQAAIGVVYVISVLFLDEALVAPKAIGVIIAIFGVCLSSLFPPGPRVSPDLNLAPGPGQSGASLESSSADGRVGPPGHDYFWGCSYALLALASKVASQIFCAQELKGASPEFMGLFSIHMGMAHIYAVLPVMLLLHSLGAPHMSFAMDTTWPMLPMIFLAGALCTFVNYGYQTVPVVRSPLFLCRFQVLGIIFAVILDYLVYGDIPHPIGYLGYGCILFSFALISGLITVSSTPKPRAHKGGRSSAREVEVPGTKGKSRVPHKLFPLRRVVSPGAEA